MAAVETDFLSDATNEKPIACSDDEKETNGSKARECPSNLHREKSISPTIDSEQTSAGSRICQQTNRELETKPKGGKEEYDKCQAGDIECHSSIDILPEKNCAEKANTLKDYFINSRQMETLDSNNGNGEKHRCPENEQDAVNQDKQSHFSRESVYKSSAQLIEAAQGSSMKSTTQRSQLPNFLQVENGSISFISVPSNVLPASPGSDAPKKKQKCEPKVKKEPQDDIKISDVGQAACSPLREGVELVECPFFAPCTVTDESSGSILLAIYRKL
ncbi:hypothetical protein RRG08_033925 [Elysia crispata]|uniref:Uncharacterized protein n=1 Tax=Elysia crispata TaxID=231223 RepID=A0AAE1B8X9_9GAST|nr:hypothetical protein RRG08_033925 [Elysia crispata]